MLKTVKYQTDKWGTSQTYSKKVHSMTWQTYICDRRCSYGFKITSNNELWSIYISYLTLAAGKESTTYKTL
jgi:hypothetical protein